MQNLTLFTSPIEEIQVANPAIMIYVRLDDSEQNSIRQINVMTQLLENANLRANHIALSDPSYIIILFTSPEDGQRAYGILNTLTENSPLLNIEMRVVGVISIIGDQLNFSHHLSGMYREFNRYRINPLMVFQQHSLHEICIVVPVNRVFDAREAIENTF